MWFRTPLHIAVSSLADGGTPQKMSDYMKILRLILMNKDADPEAIIAPLDQKYGTPIRWAMGANRETMALLQTRLYPPYRERPLYDRVCDILARILNANLLPQLLKEEELDHAAFEVANEKGTMLTHGIAQSIGGLLYGKTVSFDPDTLDYTRRLLAKASRTESLHAMCTRGTPFNFFLRGGLLTYRDLKAKKHFLDSLKPVLIFQDAQGRLDISSMVQRWATELSSVGFSPQDLVRYGRKTHKKLISFDRIYAYFTRVPNFDSFSEWRLIGFEYGPRIEDWKGYISSPWADLLDDYFAEFWYVIEHPWEFMVGAWED